MGAGTWCMELCVMIAPQQRHVPRQRQPCCCTAACLSPAVFAQMPTAWLCSHGTLLRWCDYSHAVAVRNAVLQLPSLHGVIPALNGKVIRRHSETVTSARVVVKAKVT